MRIFIMIIFDIDKVLKKKSKKGTFYHSLLLKNIKGEMYWVNVFENSSFGLFRDFQIDLDNAETFKGIHFMFIYTKNGNNKNYKFMLPLE